MKKILALLLMVVVLTTFALTGCGDPNASTLDDGKLVIGYTIYPPMNYTDDNGDFVGFDTELAKLFCQKLGVNAEFKEINWDNKFIDLESKNIDVIWNGMTITDEVKEKTAASKPYFENKQVVICKTEDASLYTSAASLQGVNVVVEGGSAGESVATAAGANVTKADAQKDTLMEVKTGASKAAIIDLTMAQVLVGEGTDYADLTYVDVGFELEEFGVAFRKADLSLAKAFDMFIAYAKEDGSFDALFAKYFG